MRCPSSTASLAASCGPKTALNCKLILRQQTGQKRCSRMSFQLSPSIPTTAGERWGGMEDEQCHRRAETFLKLSEGLRSRDWNNVYPRILQERHHSQKELPKKNKIPSDRHSSPMSTRGFYFTAPRPLKRLPRIFKPSTSTAASPTHQIHGRRRRTATNPGAARRRTR